MSPTDYLRDMAKREQKPAASSIMLTPTHPLRCPCVAIYSHCYCHLRKQTAQ